MTQIDPGMQKYVFSWIQSSDAQWVELTRSAQHPIYDNITRTDSSIPIYAAKVTTFDQWDVSPNSSGPCIIERGYGNTTHCMRTRHWKP